MTLCVLAMPAGPALAAYETEWSAGHGDIGLAFEDGELELHYHFESGAVLNGTPVDGTANPDGVELEPDEAYVRVGDNTFSPTYNNGAGAYLLPQNSASGIPFVGLASEELDNTGYSNATVTLTAFSGAGTFELLEATATGLNYFMDTDDGVTSADTVALGVPTHAHYTYAFSDPGIYDLTLTADVSGSNVAAATDTATFRFVVGSATAVPEPGSAAALLAIGGMALAARRRRR